MRCADYVIKWENLHAALQVDLSTYRRQTSLAAASQAAMPATNATGAHYGNSLRPATPSDSAQTHTVTVTGQQRDKLGEDPINQHTPHTDNHVTG